jgi:hypothetical protein
MKALRARVVPAKQLVRGDMLAMFRVFEEYYDEVSFETFCLDLANKDDVILLLDAKNVIQGFSTMRNLHVKVDGRDVYGLFSGDTVVAKAYWGQRVLGRAFLAYLFKQKAKHPWSPYWWFLISKGYKTYLLMANNFGEYYPAVERATPPEAKAILDAFGSTLYPDDYCADTGVIAFEQSHGQLRRGIADVTPELLSHPKIAFFQKMNPRWAQGSELACIARMTWGMPFYYLAKALAKGAFRPMRRALPVPPPSTLTPSMAKLRAAGGGGPEL